ncbi:hypothetical protein IE81DRAFT_365332 [Ceraceosorus guamensis]|uniref:Uncharacterized protein n=1 Tax=Ceraceosorus guamensis TaxID=1522189 RepID=A0A316W8B0_9BASI|nr:hypothetical protein IE81DRAFT_365332 [Ceraceosorus guamensis]PWN43915.1 hypothetical protein IE81DRAFT_365332 [Ceraceosorus guamensis]
MSASGSRPAAVREASLQTPSTPTTPQRAMPQGIPASASWAQNRYAENNDAEGALLAQSLPHAAEATTSQRGLWGAVGASIRAASAARSSSTRAERDADQAWIHRDEFSGWLRSGREGAKEDHRSSGASAGQWESLARLFEEPSRTPGGKRSSARHSTATSGNARHGRGTSSSAGLNLEHARISVLSDSTASLGHEPGDSSIISLGSPTTSRGRTATARQTQRATSPSHTDRRQWTRFLSPGRGPHSSARGTSASDAESISEEPDSFIDADPEHIPRGEDPLAYSEDKRLLDDSDDEGEPSRSDQQPFQAAVPRTEVSPRRSWRTLWEVMNGSRIRPVHKDIFKCAIAYFLASLFTYAPLLSQLMADILPDRDGVAIPISNLFLVATVSVYFHPGRSMGSMIEADIFAALAFVYSIALGLVSMITAVALHQAGFAAFSNILTVVLFIGCGMGLVGYTRAKLVRPAFSSAASLIGVIVFTVIAKEGGTHFGRFETDKVYDVSLVVAVGALVTNTVCFLLWPQSACTNLESDIQRNLQGFATLLRVLTKTFLLDDPDEFHIRADRIKKASDNLHASFTSLKKNLGEAKLEAPFDWRMRGQISSYVSVVECMNGLALHLGGLRSSCGLQHDIMAAQRVERQAAEQHGIRMPEHDQNMAVAGAVSGRPLSALIDDQDDSNDEQAEAAHFQERAVAFNAFLEGVGPHMRSLVFTCARSLNDLRSAFGTRPAAANSPNASPSLPESEGGSFRPLAEDVALGLKRFQHEQDISTKRLYTVYPLAKKASDSEDAGIGPMLGASPGFQADEEVFVIFYFLFLLEEFARDLQHLISVMDHIRQARQESQSALTPWACLRPWRFLTQRRRQPSPFARRRRTRNVWQRFAHLLSLDSTRTLPDWPSHKRHQLHTAQTPAARTLKQRAARWVWELGQWLRQPDSKFGLKAGIGCALLASPAFITATRPVFLEFQGQWAIVTFMVILQPTMGQSNNMVVHQTVGTIVGAGAAYFARMIFKDNWIALAMFGFLYSLPCFDYIISKPVRAQSGRFSIVTYNLVALYSYTLRGEGMDVEQLAIRRAIAVVIGVVSATAMNSLVWPFEARRELAYGLSELLFNLSALYQRLVLTYSSSPPRDEEPHSDLVGIHDDLEEAAPLLESALHGDDIMQAMELQLQVQLISLEGLLAQTKHEFRLKGPFPVSTYKKYLGCCQNILDKLHAMRGVTGRRDWHTRVRSDFVVPVDATGVRREMVGNVLLFFYLLGSAFHLKTPMPPYLPPAERSRLALLETIRELPAVKRRAVRGSSAYLLYFSYALSMKDLIWQLEEIGRLTQDAFGVLGGSVEAFEAQFQRGEHSLSATPRMTPRASYVPHP